MRRREFLGMIGGMAATWPRAARAQRAGNMKRIGVLFGPAENEEGRSRLAAFYEGLRALGHAPGRDVEIDVRWAAGDNTKAQALAKELVSLKPDVIFSTTTVATRALKQATTEIPIIFATVSDPVGDALIASLARPGGNITGFTSFEFSVASKWLDILKEIAPQATRIAMLFNPATAPGGGMSYVRVAEAAARGSRIVAMPVGSVDDINRSMDQFAAQANGGLIVLPDSFTGQNTELIVAAAARNRLPAIHSNRSFSTAGGLVSYGLDATVQPRQAATYVDRILRGEKVSGLPVQAPNKFDLVINLKTAKTLGLTVPLTLQASADEVIE
jgi:putative ABC transport system substrate-binding protein